MNTPRKIRKRAFSLKFFSLRTKLILSLVFVLITVGIFSYNYLKEVKADNLIFSETFSTAVKKDANATTGMWDTVLGQARLLGKDWVNMAETKNGNELVVDEIPPVLQEDEGNDLSIQLYNNNPRLIWGKMSGALYTSRYIQWSVSQWGKPDGSSGYDEFSGIFPQSYAPPKMVLDSAGNPRVLVNIYPGVTGLAYTQWSPSACGGTGCWTKADGITPGYDQLTSLTGNIGDLAIDSSGIPQVSFKNFYIRWNPSGCGGGGCWTNFNGDISGSEQIPDAAGTTAYGTTSKLQMYNDMPQVVAQATIAGQTKIVYSKWTVGAGLGVCITGPDCWTNAAGTSKGFENISGAFNNNQDSELKLKLDSLGRPHVSWINSTGNNEVFYTQWSGSSWTLADNVTPGPENVSNTADNSSSQDFELDTGDNPRFIWYDSGAASTLYYIQWTSAACLGVGCWTGADNITPLKENISQHPAATNISFPGIHLWNDKAKVVWIDDSTGDKEVYYTQWTGGFWSKADNVTLGSDNISNSASSDSWQADFKLDSTGNPLIAYADNKTGDFDIYFSKWLPGYKTGGTIQSQNINSSSDFINSAALTATDAIPVGTNINYFISNNGGGDWYSVPGDGTMFTFTPAGADLRWKAELSGTAADTPLIDKIDILYKTRPVTCSLNRTAINEGENIIISASTGFTASAVWATIEKNEVNLSNVTLLNTGGNNWQADYHTTVTNHGQNNVTVYATESAAPNATYVCNPSTGADWQEMTRQDIPWGRRYLQNAISFNNQLYVMGGVPEHFSNEVWRSADNGVTWSGPVNAGWSPRGNFGLLNYQGKLWVMGGAFWEDEINDVPPVINYNDVWSSSNGSTWNPEAVAPWVNRQYFGYTVFDNKIWVVGGLNNPDFTINRYKQDVWSYDGNTATWTCVAGPTPPCPGGSTPAWSARFAMPLVAWDEDGSGPIAKKLWLIGGYTSALVQTKEIYSSPDGLNWTLVTNNPAWGNPPGAARAFHQVLVYDEPNDLPDLGEKMYLMGGANFAAGEVNYNDVWVTTINDTTPGADWTLLTNPPDFYAYNTNPATDWPSWSARRNFSATVHNNEMWVTGGYEATARQTWNDVWHTNNGTNWSLVGANYGGLFQKRWASQMVGFDSDGPLGSNPDKLYILGGITGAIGPTNDVWSSPDGTNWTLDLATEPGPVYTRWSPRWNHKAITYNNKIYIIGGCNSGDAYCMGTCSVSKTLCTNGALNTVYAQTFCPAGETCQSAAFEEVWSSTDGTTWICEEGSLPGCTNPAPPWVGRGLPSISIFNDGTGDKLWMTGGNIWGRCNGGTRNGSICNASNGTQCPVSNTCSKICMGGDNKGAFCTIDANCPASVCAGINDRYLNDVWNFDGTTWNSGSCSLSPTTKCNKNADCGAGVCNVNKATWPVREISTSVAYDDGTGEKLYIMGGWNNDSMKDVWSTPDGKTWTQLADPPWFYSYTHQLFNYDNNIVMFGGSNWHLTAPFKRQGLKYLWTDKVWSTPDGVNWNSVTADAAWPGRDFFTATIFKNRLWLMGGDSAVTAENDVWASKFDFSAMTFSVSTAPGSGSSCSDTTPEDPTSVSPSCTATSPSAISWNFQDNAACENGYNLYDSVTDIKIKFVEISNLSSIEENSGLSVNTQYSRYVKAYNAAGESAPTAVSTCFTLAQTPKQPIVLSVTEDKIVLQIDPNDDNPAGTEYAIRELNSGQFVQADGTFGADKTWQTYAVWGGDNGVPITGVLPAQPTQPIDQNTNLNAAFNITLTNGQSYSFVVIARNGDGLETAPSAAVSSITSSVPVTAPKIVTAKGVGINLNLAKNNNNFFSVALAAGGSAADSDTSKSESLLREFSLVLNLLILILLGFLSGSILGSFKHLGKDLNWHKKLMMTGQILVKEPATIFSEHAQKNSGGTYLLSYQKHRQNQLNAQRHLQRAVGLIAIKAIVLITLLTGLVGVNHFGKAQTAPYDQTGQQVNVGDTLNYIIEFANQGTDIAKDVVVTDNLDSSLNYVADSAKIKIGLTSVTNGIVVSGNSLTFNLGNLNPDDSGYITFEARVRADSENQTISNLAQVSGSNFAAVFTNIASNLVKAAVVPLCGNKVIDPVEQCDQTATPAGCASDERCVNCRCQEIPPLPVCGNGIKETGEQCDPGGCGLDQICTNCHCQPNTNTNINTNTNTVPSIPPITPPTIPPTTPPTTPPTIPPNGPGGINQPIFPPDIPIISDIFNPIFNVILDPVNTILNNKQAEQVSQDIITPAILAVAVIATIPAILATSIFVLPYLHLIFLEPLLLLFGKKRKKWGVVYNSLSKVPVDLALVRLYSRSDNRLIQTRVTDKDGRYIFVINQPGKYYISVAKPGFNYPTKYLKDEKQDTKFLDLYHGEMLDVTEKNAVITANIPLDLAEQKVLPLKEVITSYFVKNLRLVVSYIGMVLALLIVLIYPTVITIGALMVHIALFLIFRRLQVPPKPKSWGIIYDTNTKEPLGQSVVRIFDLKFNKLLETQITDKKGRYSFLVGKNEYQLLTEKDGYNAKEVKPVDLVKNEEVINMDVGMQKT